MTNPPDQSATWVTIAEAASRLGLTPYGIRSRIRRNTLRTRPGNDGRVLVGISASAEGLSADRSADQAGDHDDDAADEVEYWRGVAERAQITLARVEARIEALNAHHDELLAELRSTVALERERADRLAAQLAEARKPALVRLLEAFRRR